METAVVHTGDDGVRAFLAGRAEQRLAMDSATDPEQPEAFAPNRRAWLLLGCRSAAKSKKYLVHVEPRDRPNWNWPSWRLVFCLWIGWVSEAHARSFRSVDSRAAIVTSHDIARSAAAIAVPTEPTSRADLRFPALWTWPVGSTCPQARL